MLISFIFLALISALHDTDSIQIEIPQVIVTSTKIKTDMKNIAQPSIERTIQENSKLTLIRRGPSAAEPVVRGSSAGEILTTLDGARLQTACTDHMDPATSYVENNDLTGINVETGADALKNGAQSLGHVNLNFLHAQTGDRDFKCKLDLGGTSNENGFRGSGTVKLTSPVIATDLTGAFKKIEDYADPDGLKRYSGTNAANILSNTTVNIGDATKVNITLLYDKFWDTGYPSLYMDVGFSKIYHSAVGITHLSKKEALFSSLIYANKTEHSMDDTHRAVKDMHMDMPGEGSTLGGWVKASKKIGKDTLQTRIEVWESAQSASMTMYDGDRPSMYMETWPQTRTTGFQGIVSNVLPITEKLYFDGTIGAEYHYVDVLSVTGKKQINMLQENAPTQQNLFIPSIATGLRYVSSKKCQLSLEFSFSERAPSMDEFYGYYLYNASANREYVGNSYLQPEKFIGGELNGEFRNDKFETKISLYASAKYDLIAGRDRPDISPMTYNAYGVREWVNQGEYYRGGVEIDLSLKPFSLLEIRSLSHLNFDKVKSTSVIVQVPSTGGLLDLVFKTKFANVIPEFEWEPDQKRLNASGRDGRIGSDGYFVPHFRFTGKIPFAFALLSWRAGVENIFNLKWRSNLDWDDATEHKATPLYRPGRSFYLGILTGS